jgi:hypothetical protein
VEFNHGICELYVLRRRRKQALVKACKPPVYFVMTYSDRKRCIRNLLVYREVSAAAPELEDPRGAHWGLELSHFVHHIRRQHGIFASKTYPNIIFSDQFCSPPLTQSRFSFKFRIPSYLKCMPILRGEEACFSSDNIDLDTLKDFSSPFLPSYIGTLAVVMANFDLSFLKEVWIWLTYYFSITCLITKFLTGESRH